MDWSKVGPYAAIIAKSVRTVPCTLFDQSVLNKITTTSQIVCSWCIFRYTINRKLHTLMVNLFRYSTVSYLSHQPHRNPTQ